jgi:sec-independent protein translocase protein TatC
MPGMAGYDERLTLVEHLSELRNRIIAGAIALAVGFAVAAIFDDFVFDLLLHPLPADLRKITTFSPAEPFMVSLKVWIYVGIILASPVLIYEFWAFVGPALAPMRQRQVLLVAAVCTLLFLFGVVFGYLLVLPRGLSWLLGFNNANGDHFNVQNRAGDYFSFIAWFLVAFGAVFELPVLIVAAVRMGVVDTRFLRKNRKYAVLINAIIAMVATPSQDAFSMIAMWIPLMFLYEVSLVVARFVERRERIRNAGAGSGDEPDEGPGATPLKV